MKRLGLLISICVIALFAACAQQEVSKERHIYSPEDRPPTAVGSASASYFNPHGMDTNAGMADVIAQVEITSGQQTKEFTLPDGPSYTACYYEAEIQQIWHGQPHDDNIKIWFPNVNYLLHKNDQLIVYVAFQEPDMYVPVDGEYSVFVLNPPDDTVFPYGMLSAYTDYLENDVSVLKDATAAVLSRIESGEKVVPEFLYGAVAEEHLPESPAG